MKQLTTLISAFLFLIVGVSQVWALPNCVGARSISWQNCFGTYTWSDGENYVGEFSNGEFHGQGTFTYAAGDRYVGEFKDGDFNGQGTYTYANGDKYVGDWKDDERTGQGTYTYANGSKDVGAFENNKLNGYVTTYYADGSINQEGIFKDDVFLYAQKKSKIDKHKEFCEEIGFTPKTEGFGNCVLELMKKD